MSLARRFITAMANAPVAAAATAIVTGAATALPALCSLVVGCGLLADIALVNAAPPTAAPPTAAPPVIPASPAPAPPSAAATATALAWNARELFDRGVTRDARLAPSGQFLELDRGVLVEDDGPAAGYSYLPNEEIVGGDVVVEKQLRVADPRADGATLLVGSMADFNFTVNGAAVPLEPRGKAGNYWRQYAVPLDKLVSGPNRFELRGAGKLWIALDQDYAAGSETRRAHPNRSRKSVDGGKTWTDRGLGPKGDLDGEYYVRLFLDQYRPAGVWWSPVVDLANLHQALLSPAGDHRLSFRVRAIVGNTQHGAVRVAVRTGPRLPCSLTAARSAAASHPDDVWEGWSDWQIAAADSDTVQTTASRGRFAQARIEWTTSDPRHSPRISGLEWQLDAVATNSTAIPGTPTTRPSSPPGPAEPGPAEPGPAAPHTFPSNVPPLAISTSSAPLAKRLALPRWSSRLRIEERTAPEIRRSAIPFVYEPPDSAALAELRRVERLDERIRAGGPALAATASATTQPEWALITRLAAWSALRWSEGHLGQVYPPWNALEILKPHADGKPVGGFCQQFNVVFLQACESFGLLGRAVSIGAGDHGLRIRSGHEVVEIWSNEFGKWVYIDGQAAWYFVNERDVPLSLLELRERQLAARDGKPVAAPRLVRVAETKWTWTGLDGWPAFAELRLVPRSDWLARSAPLPLNQGMRGWFWSGHHVWTDDAYPASRLYGQRIGQPASWEWTANAAAARLQATETPGELRVAVEAVVPGGGHLQIRENDDPPRTMDSEFAWKLRPGLNRLIVAPINRSGRSVTGSHFAVRYDPAP